MDAPQTNVETDPRFLAADRIVVFDHERHELHRVEKSIELAARTIIHRTL